MKRKEPDGLRMIGGKNPGKFDLGRIVATPGALDALQRAEESAPRYLALHARGDWGDVCQEDAKLNNDAVTSGKRILSAYTLKSGVKIWILTEGSRECTTILLPEDY